MSTTTGDPHGAEFLTQAEVVRRLGIGATTLRRMVSRGDFPPPIKIGPRRIAWHVSDYDRWLDARRAERAGVPSTDDVDRETLE